jgi:hypothetical protein
MDQRRRRLVWAHRAARVAARTGGPRRRFWTRLRWSHRSRGDSVAHRSFGLSELHVLPRQRRHSSRGLKLDVDADALDGANHHAWRARQTAKGEENKKAAHQRNSDRPCRYARTPSSPFSAPSSSEGRCFELKRAGLAFSHEMPCSALHKRAFKRTWPNSRFFGHFCSFLFGRSEQVGRRLARAIDNRVLNPFIYIKSQRRAAQSSELQSVGLP